jgi:hypothetical protein
MGHNYESVQSSLQIFEAVPAPVGGGINQSIYVKTHDY